MIQELFRRQSRDVLLTRGRTSDNAAHLSPRVLEQLQDRYAGTRLGRQELDAELLDDTEGAFWNRAMLDDCRTMEPFDLARLQKIVVAIDPALSSHRESDETGIIAAARGHDGLFYVLADHSGRYTPDGWARRAVDLLRDLKAQQIVAEVNAGGDLVERLLRQIAPALPFKPVRALRGKAERAMPIAALYEQGRVRHAGVFPLLENQMCRFTGLGMTSSPDRVDALVWALTELDERQGSGPRIHLL